MRVFFAVRSLWLALTRQEERDLPLTPPHTSAKVDEIVDTSGWCGFGGVGWCPLIMSDNCFFPLPLSVANCDLVACRVVVGDR